MQRHDAQSCYNGTLHFMYSVPTSEWAKLAQSLQRLATGWTLRGSNPGGSIYSAPVQTGPGAHPTSYTMGTGSLAGVMKPGLTVTHPPPPSTKVKEGVELYLYSPPVSSCCYSVNFVQDLRKKNSGYLHYAGFSDWLF